MMVLVLAQAVTWFVPMKNCAVNNIVRLRQSGAAQQRAAESRTTIIVKNVFIGFMGWPQNEELSSISRVGIGLEKDFDVGDRIDESIQSLIRIS